MPPPIVRLALLVTLIALAAGAASWRDQQNVVVNPHPSLLRADPAVAPSTPASQLPDAIVKLLGKIIITAVFGLAALYVVLARRYDAETKRWAFSVLTLIAGVWLGTAT